LDGSFGYHPKVNYDDIYYRITTIGE